MAIYKYQEFLKHSNHEAYDQVHHPGARTPRSGIYRCENCGINEVSTFSHPPPPQNQHQHNPAAAILWRLIVATK